MVKTRINPQHYLHLDNFIKLINNESKLSCIITELRQKILAKPAKYAAKSVLIGDKTTKRVEL